MKKLFTYRSFYSLSRFLLTGLLLFNILSVCAQNTWKQQSLGVTDQSFDVAYGAGKYVMVGARGLIRTSADGAIWTTRPAGLSEYGAMRTIMYAKNMFVAAGTAGVIVTSDDGITWTQRASGTTWGINSIAYGGGTFVGVGDYGALITSADGVNWSVRNYSDPITLASVTYGNGLFVAVGAAGAIKTSSNNGVTWIARSSGTQKELRGVTAGKYGRFVAVGDYCTILHSPDGISWTQKSGPGVNIFLSSVVCNPDNGQFVAVGSHLGKILTSPDGLDWTDAPVLSGTDDELYSVRFLQGQYVFTGSSWTFRRSTNGKSWSSPSVDFSHITTFGTAFGNGRFVTVGSFPMDNGTTGKGNANLALTSTNATDYTVGETIRLYGAAEVFNDVAFGNGRFVAVGADAIIQTSMDGLKWEYSQLNLGHTLKSVTYGGGRFVAVGNYGLILWSADGKNWTKSTSAATFTFNGVNYVNGQFVVTGNNGVLGTSNNGVTWMFRNTGTTNHLNGVAYGNGKYMAVGFNSTIVTSPNGIQWTSSALTPNTTHFNDIIFENGQFVLVALNGKIVLNKNNVWIRPTTGTTKHFTSITHGNGKFLVGGYECAAFTSNDDNGPGPVATDPNPPKCTKCRTDAEGNLTEEVAENQVPFHTITYPNPVDDQFSVQVEGATGENVRLQLLDASGRLILDKLVIAEQGAYQENIPMAQKQTGLYLLRVSSSTQTQTLKIVKR